MNFEDIKNIINEEGTNTKYVRKIWTRQVNDPNFNDWLEKESNKIINSQKKTKLNITPETMEKARQERLKKARRIGRNMNADIYRSELKANDPEKYQKLFGNKEEKNNSYLKNFKKNIENIIYQTNNKKNNLDNKETKNKDIEDKKNYLLNLLRDVSIEQNREVSINKLKEVFDTLSPVNKTIFNNNYKRLMNGSMNINIFIENIKDLINSEDFLVDKEKEFKNNMKNIIDSINADKDFNEEKNNAIINAEQINNNESKYFIDACNDFEKGKLDKEQFKKKIFDIYKRVIYELDPKHAEKTRHEIFTHETEISKEPYNDEDEEKRMNGEKVNYFKTYKNIVQNQDYKKKGLEQFKDEEKITAKDGNKYFKLSQKQINNIDVKRIERVRPVVKGDNAAGIVISIDGKPDYVVNTMVLKSINDRKKNA